MTRLILVNYNFLMTKNEEPPKLRYALSDATCCGEGLDVNDGAGGELRGMADKNLLQRTKENATDWGFTPDYNSRPAHGLGHEVLINSASVYPQTQEMQRIINAPRYQGDMQWEFFVVGVQNTVEELHKNRAEQGSPFLSKSEIENKIKENILKNYANTHNKTLGEMGQKGAFMLSKLQGGKKSPFEIRQEHGFHDMRIFDRASSAANFGGEPMDWQARMQDGDSFKAKDGTTYYFETIKEPDFEDQTWADVTSRAAMFIYQNQTALSQSETIEAFMQSTTEGQLYAAMLLDETADPDNRNTHFEEIIGFNPQRHNAGSLDADELHPADDLVQG